MDNRFGRVWKTKIFIHDNGVHDLILKETGDVVATGSSSHVWDERMRWEAALNEPQQLSLNFED